jgi:hypothetical protein
MDIEYDDLEPGISPDEQASGFRRIAQIVIGVTLVVAGTAMLVIPGPGIVTIMVGLNLIVPDNPIVRWIRRKVPGVPETGSVPTGHIVLGVGLMAIGTVVGILWGADIMDWGLGLIGLR